MARVTLGFSGATRTLTRNTLTRSDGYGFWRVRVRVWRVLRVLKPLAGCNTERLHYLNIIKHLELNLKIVFYSNTDLNYNLAPPAAATFGEVVVGG